MPRTGRNQVVPTVGGQLGRDLPQEGYALSLIEGAHICTLTLSDLPANSKRIYVSDKSSAFLFITPGEGGKSG